MRKKDGAPRPTKQESRADRTDRAAREIIQAEEEASQSKTARLRAARLKLEARPVPQD